MTEIFPIIPLTETPEKGFVSALASATIVHRITSACSANELGSECGCDYSRNGLLTPEGWQWGSCSDNISYGVHYARNFLDARDLDADSNNETEIANALVHLHNNEVGRKVRILTGSSLSPSLSFLLVHSLHPLHIHARRVCKLRQPATAHV